MLQRGSAAETLEISMALPFGPPLEPMLAKLAKGLPAGEGWLYEPKWDGFRALVFKDGREVYLQSRDLKPLARYFPELAAALRARVPGSAVLDGEIVIAGAAGVLDFDALLLRIHPAASRIALLAQETPASFVAWDLLAVGRRDLRGHPLAERRARLEALVAGAAAPLHLTPATRDRSVAEEWFRSFEGAGLDGVVAKRLDGVYEPGRRLMVKTKHARTADCVVAGFRWLKGSEGRLVGSLLLGLYGDDGLLHHVGVCAAFTTAKRRELASLLAPLRRGAREGHPWRDWAEWVEGPAARTAARSVAAEDRRVPGASSRWSRGKDLSWEPLRPERVCEVAYDHLQGDRFRHATQFVRWRPDKSPQACRYDQLEVSAPLALAEIFEQEQLGAPRARAAAKSRQEEPRRGGRAGSARSEGSAR
jgi:ATP-dependent DNA ligase